MATAASSSRIPAGLTVIHPARVRQSSYRARTHCIRDFILSYTTESERHIFLSDSAERNR